MRKIRLNELTFEAAHYLPGHPKCSVIHGHTYVVRNLVVTCDDFVDFGDIKEVVRDWDHRLIIPKDHANFWLSLPLEKVGASVKLKFVDGPPTVENISEAIAQELLSLPHVTAVSFELYEGLNQGCVHAASTVSDM